MITNNFKNLLKTMLTMSAANRRYGVPVTDIDGNTTYAVGQNQSGSWPYSLAMDFYANASAAGIHLGSGTTAPSVNDYSLESRIYSGLSVTKAEQVGEGLDSSGNLQCKTVLTVKNNNSSSVTIGEIGYVQNIRCVSTQGETTLTTKRVLFDRTLLNNPVTIPAGESAAITYVLKTVLS